MIYGNSSYGATGYGDVTTDNNTGIFTIDLMTLLPDYYQGVKEMNELQFILGEKVGNAVHDTQDLLNQCFVATSTQGLDRWEKIFGIQTDKSKSYERRREILLAKIRGSGTTTKEMIRNTATAFAGGEVSIQEYPSEYRFVVQFIGIKGIPQNMSGLIAALDEIKPAHLSYSFKYTYTTWNQLDGLSWSDAEQKTWGDLRIFEGE